MVKRLKATEEEKPVGNSADNVPCTMVISKAALHKTRLG